MARKSSQPLARLVDALQGRGRYSFTRDEVAGAVGRSPSGLDQALWRLRGQGRLVSPRRGFYVIVPAEYRKAGAPPATWFIDDLMRYLEQPYYVALLSAAALYGAAHQQPMLFQVMTDRPTRPVRAGRVRIVFHMSRHVEQAPITTMQTETGYIPVSTPEVTALDLVRFRAASGHLSTVATVLSELAEGLDASRLGGACKPYATPVIQRLGFLLDKLGQTVLNGALAEELAGRRLRPVELVPGVRGRTRRTDPTWRVIADVVMDVEA